MDIIELWCGTTKALVDIKGGWLTNVSDVYGDVLYPKRRMRAPDGSSRDRGGLHVCLPNFGPGGASGLPQHGFGRVAIWSVVQQVADRVTLTLRGGADGYEGMASELTYSLREASLEVSLTVKNEGAGPLRVAPGFHPYFALQDEEGSVELDGNGIELEDLSSTLFVDGTARRLQTRRRAVQLQSAELATWAIWTDQLAPYVCVEPTRAGNAFLLDEPDDTQLLSAGQVRAYRLTCRWS